MPSFCCSRIKNTGHDYIALSPNCWTALRYAALSWQRGNFFRENFRNSPTYLEVSCQQKHCFAHLGRCDTLYNRCCSISDLMTLTPSEEHFIKAGLLGKSDFKQHFSAYSICKVFLAPMASHVCLFATSDSQKRGRCMHKLG